MRTVGLTIAWIMGSVYASIPVLWLAIHPFAERWRSGKGKNYPLIAVVWLALIFIAIGLTWRWHSETLYESVWSLAIAAPLFVLGFVTYRRIGKEFGGDRLTGRAEIDPEKCEQKLVTTGMHSRMRHPIYLAHLWMLTAWTVGSGLKVLFVLWAFAIATGVMMIRLEDAELEERFGDEFREYKSRVPVIGFK